MVHRAPIRTTAKRCQLIRDCGLLVLSVVDCSGFVVIQRYQVTQALAFDACLAQEGFTPYQAASRWKVGSRLPIVNRYRQF